MNSDERKFELIYRKYADDVYRVSLYLLKDEEKAMHLAQQAFANVYKKMNEIEEQSLRSHLIHEVKNLATDFLQNKETEEEEKE